MNLHLRQTFEDECQLPKGVDAVWQTAPSDDMCHGQDVDNDEADGEYHRTEKDSKSWGHPNKLQIAELILALDIPEKTKHREDPPWISEQRFVWSRVYKQTAPITEV